VQVGPQARGSRFLEEDVTQELEGLVVGESGARQEAASAGLRANLHASDYLDLFISTTLITGVMFELPVLFFFLARFRLVTARWMLKYWRHATIIILIFSAFFTPGDVVVTTIFFSVVLLGLYFVSVAVAWAAEPRQPR
jgi:sec-independent protein translocase protein TatC